MSPVQSRSVHVPTTTQAVRSLAVDAWRRAEAMGIVEPGVAARDVTDVARLVRHLREAGIARGPALHFDTATPPTATETEALLRLVLAALEASPVPTSEWPVLSRVFDAEGLASLLGTSVSSLRRYASGERDTPDDVAARLHHLALVVGDLAGAYNDVGIRRWFHRTRSALDGRTPAALLSEAWSPEDPGPQRVRELARALVSLGAV
jgi:hypothetical protein